MRRNFHGGVYRVALAFVLAALPLLASGNADPLAGALQSGKPGEPQAVARPAGVGLVRGTVVDASGRRVLDVTVRLRDIDTGRALDLKRTDSTGVFKFEQVPPGRYVVEVIEADGRVSAVGQPVAVSADKLVETQVRLPGQLKGTSLLFSSAATAVLAAAAAIGFAVWSQAGQPVSPER